MSQTPFKLADPEANSRFFGLRIESHLLQVAIATPLEGGRFRLRIDDIKCSSTAGWLTPAGHSMLVEALATLVERHGMRRQRVAVSLDGDFCVTRVAMGTTEEVNHELATLADRVPRYLQLGPGEKVTGSSRLQIAPAVDYAVTGVVNRALIQLVYDALRSVDIEIPWVEPSLVSVARLVGHAKLGQDSPVMIADGTGLQWDVGITCLGRLLLDYRPAAATSEEALRDALDGHISRLRRFCHRHRGVVSGELNQLFLCGSGDKLDRAVAALGDTLGIEPTILHVPKLTHLYEIDECDRDARYVPAVATVLPLLIGVAQEDVPDLLDKVRRAPDLAWHSRAIRYGWPVPIAILLLCVAFVMVSGERHNEAMFAERRATLQASFAATQARFNELSGTRELLGHLQDIQEQTSETDWNRLLDRITQSLPNTGRLNEFRVEQRGNVRLNGTVLDEPAIYEFVEHLRRLPGITQVALKGTSPDGGSGGTHFVIHLATKAIENGAANE